MLYNIIEIICLTIIATSPMWLLIILEYLRYKYK